MKKRLMFLALAAIGLASCNCGFKKLGGGTEYSIADDKGGPSIKEGDFVSFNFSIKNDADSVMQSSYEKGFPQILNMPKVEAGKGNIMEVFTFLSEGDSVVIRQNIDSLVKGKPRPKQLKGKYIVYVIKVDKVIAKGNQTDAVFQTKSQEYVKGIEEKIKAREPIAIKKYIADKKLKVTTTPSGLNYEITKQGTGPLPAPGDSVSIYYTGTFVDGKGFDTNLKGNAVKLKLPINPMNPYKPMNFVPGAPGMIPGFGEAFKLFNKGTKVTLIIPSNLAYGEQGYQSVQPFTPLVFDIEVVDIIHPNPNAPKPVQLPPPVVNPAQQPVRK